MAIFKNLFRRVRFWKRTTPEPVVNQEHDITRTLKQYEYFVFKMQHILLWENPSETLLTVAVLNLFFWLFASLEWKFYGIIFTALLVTTIHEVWTKEVWPEIRVHEPVPQIVEDFDEDSPQHESLIRLSRFLESSQRLVKDYYLWLKNMRENRPAVFCSLMSGSFFSLSFIGRVVPGLVLVYLLVMVGLFAPGIWVHMVPEETKQKIIACLSSLRYTLYHTSDGLPDEEEYLPDATNEELSLLSQFVEPDCDEMISRGSSATQLSFATSCMPSHDDTSVDSLATFSDMDLNIENTPRTVHDVEDFSDDSSVANDIGIDFQSSHFNGDESSSEEEEKVFTEDLKFTEVTDSGGIVTKTPSTQNVTPADAQRGSLTNFISSNLFGLTSAIGHSYLANVLNRSGNPLGKTMVKNDSSDSLVSEEDFELISHEDLS